MNLNPTTTTKNLGQVAVAYINTTPPTNHNLIWGDTSGVNIDFKVWNNVASAWQTLNAATTAYVKNGNSFSADSSIGLQDNYALNILTNNLVRVIIANTGAVTIASSLSIGTTLDVTGTATIGGDADISGNCSVGKKISVSADMTIPNTLNLTMGIAQLSTGAVVVNNTSVKTNSIIWLQHFTPASPSSNRGILSAISIIDSTSFTIISTIPGGHGSQSDDNAQVQYWIIN